MVQLVLVPTIKFYESLSVTMATHASEPILKIKFSLDLAHGCSFQVFKSQIRCTSERLLSHCIISDG